VKSKLFNTFLGGLILSITSLVNVANAGLIIVNFVDNDGPQWEGIVDTSLNTLTINSWVEGAGGTGHWTPSAVPLIFRAYATPGVGTFQFNQLLAYDISDSWDGTIGPTWGFLSDLTKMTISWNEGVFAANNSRLGWGMAQRNDQAIVSTSFNDNTGFSFVPRSTSSNYATRADTVTFRDLKTIPEPSTFAIFALGMIGITFRRFKKLS